MDARNRDLLAEVIEDRLEKALSSYGDDGSDLAFKEAMDAVSKQIELDKIDASREEVEKKLKVEEEKNLREDSTKKEEAGKDRVTQICIFAAGLVLGPVIEVACKRGYAKMLCEFEKDYTFTTTAGRGLSGLFRFKK